MTPKNFTIGNDEYQLIPHTGFEAVNLDRKVLGLVGRIAGVEGDGIALLAGALESYSDSEFRWLVETTLKRVTVVTAGKQSRSLGNMDVVAEHFDGQMQNLYAVLFEVWRLEKLSPFAQQTEVKTDGASTTPTP